MKNPNAYVDDEYASAVGKLNSVIDSLWRAGASIDNIETEIANALENATDFAMLVEIDGDARFAAA